MDERRLRLAESLLGLKRGEAVTPEQKRLSESTAAVILSDMIGHIKRAITERGAGLPVVRPDGGLAWYTADEVTQELDRAVRQGDKEMVTAFRGVISLLEKLDPEDHIIIGMATDTSLRIFKIPTDDPARNIRKLLDQWGR